MWRAVGIDLSGLETNPSGFAVLFGRRVEAGVVYRDSEIMGLITALRPEVVAIDAPLSLPEDGYFREVDRRLMSMGFRVLPPRFRGMEALARRGISLARRVETRVIEVHPGSAARIIGVGREVDEVTGWLADRGFLVYLSSRSRHVADAILSVISALCFLLGEHILVSAKDGEVVLPRRECCERGC